MDKIKKYHNQITILSLGILFIVSYIFLNRFEYIQEDESNYIQVNRITNERCYFAQLTKWICFDNDNEITWRME